MESLASLLRTAREGKKNQVELASELGFSPGVIARAEQGKSIPPPERLRRIAAALEVDAEPLIAAARQERRGRATEKRSAVTVALDDDEVRRLKALSKTFRRSFHRTFQVVLATGLRYAEKPDFTILRLPAAGTDVGDIRKGQNLGGGGRTGRRLATESAKDSQ